VNMGSQSRFPWKLDRVVETSTVFFSGSPFNPGGQPALPCPDPTIYLSSMPCNSLAQAEYEIMEMSTYDTALRALP
jgi:hypothetical protein